jgi:hypothetical protein
VICPFSRATPSSPLNDIGLFRVVYCDPMRLIFAVCIALFAGMTPVIVAQENAQRKSSGITLYVPPDIASETVQIKYFMLGPFGGYGGYVTAEKGRVSYDIPASVNGKPAGAVKIIAYLPGCEIAKLEITMQGASEARNLPCKALGRVPLHGRILPVSVVQTPGIERCQRLVSANRCGDPPDVFLTSVTDQKIWLSANKSGRVSSSDVISCAHK